MHFGGVWTLVLAIMLYIVIISNEYGNLCWSRAMPLTQALDLVFDKSYRPMRDCGIDDEGILVYRDGTLDHITKMVCNLCSNDSNDRDSTFSNIFTSSCIKRASCNNMNDNPADLTYLVPLKDLFPSRNILSPSWHLQDHHRSAKIKPSGMVLLVLPFATVQMSWAFFFPSHMNAAGGLHEIVTECPKLDRNLWICWLPLQGNISS